VLAGLLGIGGGAIIVPALGLALELFGTDPDVVQHVAVGSSLAIIIPTGIFSSLSHFRRGAVDLHALRLWVPFILAGTLTGGLMAGLFSGNALRILFGVIAFTVAINILTGALQKLIGHLKGSTRTHRAFAFVTGYLSALMGIGGGSLSVPVQVALGQTMHNAVGTGAAIGVAIALAGTTGFVVSGWTATNLPPFSLGFVNLPAVALVGVLASATAPLGAGLAHRLDQRALKLIFAGFLMLMGLNMFWKALAG